MSPLSSFIVFSPNRQSHMICGLYLYCVQSLDRNVGMFVSLSFSTKHPTCWFRRGDPYLWSWNLVLQQEIFRQLSFSGLLHTTAAVFRADRDKRRTRFKPIMICAHHNLGVFQGLSVLSSAEWFGSLKWLIERNYLWLISRKCSHSSY